MSRLRQEDYEDDGRELPELIYENNNSLLNVVQKKMISK